MKLFCTITILVLVFIRFIKQLYELENEPHPGKTAIVTFFAIIVTLLLYYGAGLFDVFVK